MQVPVIFLSPLVSREHSLQSLWNQLLRNIIAVFSRANEKPGSVTDRTWKETKHFSNKAEKQIGLLPHSWWPRAHNNQPFNQNADEGFKCPITLVTQQFTGLKAQHTEDHRSALWVSHQHPFCNQILTQDKIPLEFITNFYTQKFSTQSRDCGMTNSSLVPPIGAKLRNYLDILIHPHQKDFFFTWYFEESYVFPPFFKEIFCFLLEKGEHNWNVIVKLKHKLSIITYK